MPSQAQSTPLCEIDCEEGLKLDLTCRGQMFGRLVSMILRPFKCVTASSSAER